MFTNIKHLTDGWNCQNNCSNNSIQFIQHILKLISAYTIYDSDWYKLGHQGLKILISGLPKMTVQATVVEGS